MEWERVDFFRHVFFAVRLKRTGNETKEKKLWQRRY
jgi:hypothetical protein